MKKILITVYEFRINGGSLKAGREIFGWDGEEIGLYKSTNEYDVINIDTPVSVDVIPAGSAYVQINCTPIYV